MADLYKEDLTSVCIVHFDEIGEQTYHIFGEARLLVIDERAPDDRVYEISGKISAEELSDLIGDDPIGSASDDRHEAISARINARLDGRRSHLSVIEGGNGEEPF
jgi:hypothetical protein